MDCSLKYGFDLKFCSLHNFGSAGFHKILPRRPASALLTVHRHLLKSARYLLHKCGCQAPERHRAEGFFPLHRNPAALPASVLQASPRYPAPSPADSRYNQSVPETEGRIRSTVCFHFHHPQHKVRTQTVLPGYPARRLPVLHPTTEAARCPIKSHRCSVCWKIS